MTDPKILRRAAERARADPFFLASALLAYARAERLDDAGLAERLGCAPTDLPMLLLCRRPDKEGTGFRMDVERIAERFGLDAVRLGRILRMADTLVAFGGTPFGEPAAEGRGGLLAAARDRADDDPRAAPTDADAAPERDREPPEDER
jgi:hypothetical protein